MVDAKVKNARSFTNPVWRRRQGLELSHRGDLGLAHPGYDPPPLRGSREGL